ncbi:hypothetical protein KW783_02505 [Candidatus Parcubacteria bacterium]|nr:hypothetical protein [Candidatus Parcubacteria bacterium]
MKDNNEQLNDGKPKRRNILEEKRQRDAEAAAIRKRFYGLKRQQYANDFTEIEKKK